MPSETSFSSSSFSFFPTPRASSFLPPVPASSPLRAAQRPTRVPAAAPSSLPANTKGLLVDKPVVFHTRIRSSGYGQASASSSWRMRPPPKKKQPLQHAAGTIPQSPALLQLHEYPTHDDGPPSISQASKDETPASSSPLLHMAYSRKGDALALAALDGTVQVLRLPTTARPKCQPQSHVFSSSSMAVRQVDVSHDGELLLAASDDGTASVYSLEDRRRSSPVVRIDPSSPPTKPTTPSPPPCPAASFFYLDSFVLLASANRLSLHTYQIDIPNKDALLRHLHAAIAPGRSHKVHAWVHDHAQHITAFDCHNSILSPFLLTACSDRSLALLDAAHGAFVRVVDEAHARPVHSVCIPKSSHYVASLPHAQLDVVATASTDGTVGLWDLRAGLARVASFCDHVNRREKVGVAFAPCLRYLAVGSEDHTTYLYDLRKGQALYYTTEPAEEGEEEEGGIRGPMPPAPHTDVVSCVGFSPRKPELATGGYDGRVCFHDTGRKRK